MPVLGAKVIQSGAVVKRERAIFYKPVACNTGTARAGTRFCKKLFELFFFIGACLGNNE